LGSGPALYYKNAVLAIWFHQPLAKDGLAPILAQLPEQFGGDKTISGPMLWVETGHALFQRVQLSDDTEVLFREDAEKVGRRLAADTEAALLRLHDLRPIAFVVKEPGDELGHEFDDWHDWSMKQRQSIHGLLARDDTPVGALSLVGSVLGCYLDPPRQKHLRELLLRRFEQLMGADDPEAPTYLPLYRQLIGQLSEELQRKRVRTLPERFQLLIEKGG
jgi:hypothetical protein